MNDAVDATKPTFFTISAEGALKMVFRGYLKKLCTPGEIERRVDAAEAKALQQRRDDGLPDMFSKDKAWARRLLRDSLVNHRACRANPARLLFHRSIPGERAALRR